VGWARDASPAWVYVRAGAATLGPEATATATATATEVSFFWSSPGEVWRPRCRDTHGRKEPNKSRDRMRRGPCCETRAWTGLHCERTRAHSLRVHMREPNGFRVRRGRALLASRADTCAGVGAYVFLTGGASMLCSNSCALL